MTSRATTWHSNQLSYTHHIHTIQCASNRRLNMISQVAVFCKCFLPEIQKIPDRPKSERSGTKKLYQMVTIPRVLSTELTRIRTRPMGAMYLIMTTNIFSKWNLDESLTSSETSFVLTT